MNQRFNMVFCKDRNNIEKCYGCKKERCPSVSNLWYGFVIIPISNFIRFVKNNFPKKVYCKHPESKCSFRYGKYCTLEKKPHC